MPGVFGNKKEIPGSNFVNQMVIDGTLYFLEDSSGRIHSGALHACPAEVTAGAENLVLVDAA